MAYRYYTMQEIIDWYEKNADHPLSQGLLEHMIDKGIITRLPNKHFSLQEINNFLLQKIDCDYIKDNNDKYLFKENRVILLDKFIPKQLPQEGEYKLVRTEGNKLKLVKNK